MLSQVSFQCPLDGTISIKDFSEVSTCSYEVTILTPAVCSHPVFKVKGVAAALCVILPISRRAAAFADSTCFAQFDR